MGTRYVNPAAYTAVYYRKMNSAMGSASDTILSRIPLSYKFNGNNYSDWSEHMETLLRARGLFKIITGKEIRAEEGESASVWERRVAQAWACIYLSMTEG